MNFTDDQLIRKSFLIGLAHEGIAAPYLSSEFMSIFPKGETTDKKKYNLGIKMMKSFISGTVAADTLKNNNKEF